MPTFAIYKAGGIIDRIVKVPPEMTDLGLSEGEKAVEVPPETQHHDLIKRKKVVKQTPPTEEELKAKAKSEYEIDNPQPPGASEKANVMGSWQEEYLRAQIYQVMEEIREAGA